jgi:hypothetical protein
VDPVPDLLLLRKPGGAGIPTRTFGSVARNSDHLTTEVVKLSRKFIKRSPFPNRTFDKITMDKFRRAKLAFFGILPSEGTILYNQSFENS